MIGIVYAMVVCTSEVATPPETVMPSPLAITYL